jgi:hypothetical protein
MSRLDQGETRCQEGIHQMTVQLTAEDYTPEDLFAEWQRLSVLRSEADQLVNQYRQEWEITTDPIEKARVWNEIDQMWPHFEVLSAWTELFYTAWIFSTRGCNSEFLMGRVTGRLFNG